MRALLVLALLAAGCKDKTQGKAVDPGVACKQAAERARAAPLHARAQILVEGCAPCGDWKPVLDWSKPTAEGGPKRTEIEAAMERCKAWCSGDSKLKFLGTLDDARGGRSRTPWRQLGEICKDKVSAAPDTRFMSAPYFALDRIARAGHAHAIEIGLPALSIPGTGVAVPAVSVQGAVDCDVAITVLGETIYVGRMPRAQLDTNGVHVELGPDGYPGTAVPVTELATAIRKEERACIVAPAQLPASALSPIIAAVSPVHLAVRASGSLSGWEVPAALATPLTPAMVASGTVQDLASAIVPP